MLSARRMHLALGKKQLFLSQSCRLKHNIAVVLSGSGVYDGTEIHEATACLAALTRGGANPIFVAPDVKQAHVVDHTCGEEMKEERSVIKESARIARQTVQPITTLKVKCDATQKNINVYFYLFFIFYFSDFEYLASFLRTNIKLFSPQGVLIEFWITSTKNPEKKPDFLKVT
jgi:hypothetical protein